MSEFPNTTAYFREQVLIKRPYLKIEWCMAILEDYVQRELQPDGRNRFWGYVDELAGKALRVVTLGNGRTLHNASRDSAFTRSPMKLNYYQDTDSLYIDLSSPTSTDSREIADGLVVDFDDAGHIVGIDIQHASERIELSSIESKRLPLLSQTA